MPERVIAHRGASAYAPENTLAAFDRALIMGCCFIEFDVMSSVDGDLFVFHDETLNRTTNGRGSFGLATSDYLQSLDAGYWFSNGFRGEKIPLFRDVLVWLATSNMQANIQIKLNSEQATETTTAVLSHVNQYWPKEKALPLISSFNRDALNLCRSLAPEMPLGLLLNRWHKNWLQTARDLQCYSVHLNKRWITKAQVDEIKQHEYQVYAYTVNRKRLASQLFSWGVDAVFSDYPDLLS